MHCMFKLRANLSVLKVGFDGKTISLYNISTIYLTPSISLFMVTMGSWLGSVFLLIKLARDSNSNCSCFEWLMGCSVGIESIRLRYSYLGKRNNSTVLRTKYSVYVPSSEMSLYIGLSTSSIKLSLSMSFSLVDFFLSSK